MKKCLICEKQAEYCIKDSSDYYCKECTEDHFGDLSYLQKIEEEAIRLKEFLKEKMLDEN